MRIFKKFSPIKLTTDHFYQWQESYISQERPPYREDISLYIDGLRTGYNEYQGVAEYEEDAIPEMDGTYIVRMKNYTLTRLYTVKDEKVVSKNDYTGNLADYYIALRQAMLSSVSTVLMYGVTQFKYEHETEFLLSNELLKTSFTDCISKGSFKVAPAVTVPSNEDIANTWQFGKSENWSSNKDFGEYYEILKSNHKYILTDYGERGMRNQCSFDTLTDARAQALLWMSNCKPNKVERLDLYDLNIMVTARENLL